MATRFQFQVYSQSKNCLSQRNVWFGKPVQDQAGRFGGLVNPVLVWTDLVRIERSGLVNRFKIDTNQTEPKIARACQTTIPPCDVGQHCLDIGLTHLARPAYGMEYQIAVTVIYFKQHLLPFV